MRRHELGVAPVFKRVDTCAAEFESFTPYLYSTYEQEDESEPTDQPKIVILGSGPNRIGQGIEFDYCCCHASFALKEDGYETVMVNCNPETVSTDYDTSDRLYFEPLTLEDVLAVLEREKPQGVIVQFGGQTPLNLALELKRNGVTIIGTDAGIDRPCRRSPPLRPLARRTEYSAAEQRHGACAGGSRARSHGNWLAGAGSSELRARRPRDGDCLRFEDGAGICGAGRADGPPAQAPVLIDQFLEDATEVDVDALADGDDVLIGGIMEHIEEAGIHSGDSSCVLPPVSLSPSVLERIRDYTERLAKALHVVGLMNVQYAIQRDTVYVLEVNPRASRTDSYVSKATGVPLAKVAARLMTGRKLRDLNLPFIETNGVEELAVHDFYAVKSPVFPFNKFRGVDHDSRPGNAFHRRSDGRFIELWIGFCQGAACRRPALAAQGHRFHQCQRPRQAACRPGREGFRCRGVEDYRHARNRRGALAARESEANRFTK